MLFNNSKFQVACIYVLQTTCISPFSRSIESQELDSSTEAVHAEQGQWQHIGFTGALLLSTVHLPTTCSGYKNILTEIVTHHSSKKTFFCGQI